MIIYMKTMLLVLFLGLTTGSPVVAQTPYYQGKTINIRVGFTAGGAFDVWGRLIAQYMGKYIPGNPTLVVQNMTGGGSMIAANYVYSVAKPDGLTLRRRQSGNLCFAALRAKGSPI